MMESLKKEACRHCSKNVNIGQPITEYNNCNILIHTNCLSKAGFSRINIRLYCCNCALTVKPIYNPFENLDGLRVSSESDDVDKHYENDISDVFDELRIMRNLLNSCQSIRSVSEFNRQIESFDITDCNFSTIFKNIDGNKTNFDSFAVDIHQLQHKFSVLNYSYYTPIKFIKFMDSDQ